MGAVKQSNGEQRRIALSIIDKIGLRVNCVGKLLTTATEINVTAWRG